MKEKNPMGKKLIKNSHCGWCGASFDAGAPWPRKCKACDRMSFINPIPVAVVLVPVGEGLLAIRRGIEPHMGQMALPGGFIDFGESWQVAGAREVKEETGLEIYPDTIETFDVLSAPDGTLLVFGISKALEEADLPTFQVTNETSERVIIKEPQPLAFSLHTQIVEAFFSKASF